MVSPATAKPAPANPVQPTPVSAPAPFPTQGAPPLPYTSPTQIFPTQHKFPVSTARTLKCLKDADPFLCPVDPVTLNIPHYSLIIKHPMDFNTVETRLQNLNPNMPPVDPFTPQYHTTNDFHEADPGAACPLLRVPSPAQKLLVLPACRQSTSIPIIRQPMDLGTMRKKLDEGNYPHTHAFHNDFRLMIKNCQVYAHSKALLKSKKSHAAVAPAPPPKEKKSPVAPPKKPAQNPSTSTYAPPYAPPAPGPSKAKSAPTPKPTKNGASSKKSRSGAGSGV
ncbi:hypothetical protein FRC10_001459, partial [Ceratobasidium sp. 414]